MSLACEVLVVGGGPAGSAMALFLRQLGREVVLIDEARFPRDKVCGESVSPEAWRILDALGAAARVKQLRPHPIRGMTLTSPDGTTFSGGYGGRGRTGFGLRRDVFDRALLECAREAGADVREGVRAASPLIEDDVVCGVRAENGNGPQTLRARLVVGADGRRSRVARGLGLLHEHRSLRKFAVRGHWDGMEGLGEQGEMHVTAAGYCGIAPLSPTRANVAFVMDRRSMACAGGDLEAFYRSRLRLWPRVLERLARARLLAPPRAVGPLAICASRVSGRGVVLAGDAAGFYDPFTGEGVTLALRSAELASGVVARTLRSGSGDLSEYDRLRREATRAKFRLNHALQQVVAWPALGNAVARRLARRKDLADRLVGIAGDLVPAREALGAGFLLDLLRA